MQWHQLMDHVQIICMPQQTDNHASSPSLNFLQARRTEGKPTQL